MLKLHKLLTDNTKTRRHQRILLNIHITILAWLAEWFAYLLGFISTFLGHENNITRGLQALIGVIYFVIVPSTYLVNNSKSKAIILENKLYLALINKFFPRPIVETASNNDEDVEDE